MYIYYGLAAVHMHIAMHTQHIAQTIPALSHSVKSFILHLH